MSASGVSAAPEPPVASRFPWLTLTVTGVTAAGLLAQELLPGTLTALQRSPAGVHGEPWRWATALVVQDGWLVGGLSNIAGLVLVGFVAEQVVRRTAWLAAYVVTGLVGQVFGHWWQPVGAGNSVAVCGLVALVVVMLARGRRAPGPLPYLAPSLWCGLLGAAVWWPLVLLGALTGWVAGAPSRDPAWSAALVATFCTGCALLLLAAGDLHGGALSFALLVTAIPPVASAAELPRRGASFE
jgi:rhomboid protease GluP